VGVGRRGASLVALTAWLVGCVGTNPDWDPPGDDDEPRGESTSEGAAIDSDAVDGESGSSCGDGQWVCEGECTNVSKDPRACGFGCVDCIAWLGPDAECRGGECRSDGAGPGDSGSNSGEGSTDAGSDDDDGDD